LPTAIESNTDINTENKVRVILAEKPSVALELARVLGINNIKKADGFLGSLKTGYSCLVLWSFS